MLEIKRKGEKNGTCWLGDPYHHVHDSINTFDGQPDISLMLHFVLVLFPQDCNMNKAISVMHATVNSSDML